MSAIFISHSSRDNAVAGELRTRLAEQGHRSVFLDYDPADGIPAGHSWEQELYAQLRACQAVIVVVSEASMASDWVFAEITHARALGKPVFPLKVAPCTVRPILTDVQVTDLTVDREEGFRRLFRGLLVAGLDPRDAFDWDGSRPPYPGLLAFQEEDAAIFFGREAEIRDGLALLRRLYHFGGARWVLVLGASGSGKSSLVRAGIVPRLRRDPELWRVLTPFRPLDRPFEQLAEVLAASFAETGSPREAAEITALLTGSGSPRPAKLVELAHALRDATGKRQTSVVVVVDQLEELLGDGVGEESRVFLRFLRAAVEIHDSPLRVLATLRSDFLGELQTHPELCELPFENLAVGPLAADGYARVIEGPAALAGVELGRGLVQTMVADTATDDALPLLAFTLRELWEAYGEDARLTVEDYRERLGGLQGAVAIAAEAVLAARPLSAEQEKDLRAAFVTLVRINEDGQLARRPAPWGELLESVREVLERFVAARLLVVRGDAGERQVEVAHEALLRAWARLVGWLEKDHAFLLWRRRTENARQEWERTGKSSHALLQGPALAEAEGWRRERPAALKPEERELIEASSAASRRRRWVITAMVLVVILALAGFGTWAHFERRMAEKQRVFFHDLTTLTNARSIRPHDPGESALRLTEIEQPALYRKILDLPALRSSGRLLDYTDDLVLAALREDDGGVAVTWVFDGDWSIKLDHGAPIDAVEIENRDVFEIGQRPARPRCVLTAAEEGDGQSVQLWVLPGFDSPINLLLEGQMPQLSANFSRDFKATPMVRFNGHHGPIGKMLFSSGGGFAATVSGKEIAVWKIEAGTAPILLQPGPAEVTAVSFSADDRQMLATFADGTVHLRDLDDPFAAPMELAGHETSLAGAAFSPDGETAVSVSNDGDLWSWNLTEKRGKRFATLDCKPLHLAFDHTGENLIVGCADGTARLLDMGGWGKAEVLQ